MALLFLDSHDHYATADLVSKYTQEVASFLQALGTPPTDTSGIAAIGRRGTNGLRLKIVTNDGGNQGSKAYRKVLSSPAPSGATAIAGFSFRSVTAFNLLGTSTTQTTGACLFSFYKSGTSQIWFRLNTNGTIAAYRGTTLLGTTANALTQNVEQYIELKVLLHGSTGTVTIHVDGIEWLALTGVNTQNAGVSTWDEIYRGPVTGASASGEWNFDDLYVADGSGASWNDFVGDVRIDAVLPTTNGTTRNFTPSTGTDDFAVVDEASANGDTDYVEASAVNDVVTMNFPNAPVTGADIYGVQVVAQAKKTDAGAAGHKAVTRLGGVDYLGAEVGLGSTYQFLTQPWAVKPSDASPWTDTDFNAAEFGAKKSS